MEYNDGRAKKWPHKEAGVGGSAKGKRQRSYNVAPGERVERTPTDTRNVNNSSTNRPHRDYRHTKNSPQSRHRKKPWQKETYNPSQYSWVRDKSATHYRFTAYRSLENVNFNNRSKPRTAKKNKQKDSALPKSPENDSASPKSPEISTKTVFEPPPVETSVDTPEESGDTSLTTIEIQNTPRPEETLDETSPKSPSHCSFPNDEQLNSTPDTAVRGFHSDIENVTPPKCPDTSEPRISVIPLARLSRPEEIGNVSARDTLRNLRTDTPECRRRRHLSGCSTSQSIAAKVAGMTIVEIKNVINSHDTKYDAALKAQARKLLREEIRKELRSGKFSKANSPSDNVDDNGQVQLELLPDELVDAFSLSDLTQVFGFDILNSPLENSEEESKPILDTLLQASQVAAMLHKETTPDGVEPQTPAVVSPERPTTSMIIRSRSPDKINETSKTIQEDAGTASRVQTESFEAFVARNGINMATTPVYEAGNSRSPREERNSQKKRSFSRWGGSNSSVDSHPRSERTARKESGRREFSAGRSSIHSRSGSPMHQPVYSAQSSPRQRLQQSKQKSSPRDFHHSRRVRSRSRRSRPSPSSTGRRSKSRRRSSSSEIIVIDSSTSRSSSSSSSSSSSDISSSSAARRYHLKLRMDAEYIIDSFHKLVLPHLSTSLRDRYYTRYAHTTPRKLHFISCICTSDYNSERFHKSEIARLQRNLRSKNNGMALDFLKRELLNVSNKQKQVARAKVARRNLQYELMASSRDTEEACLECRNDKPTPNNADAAEKSPSTVRCCCGPSRNDAEASTHQSANERPLMSPRAAAETRQQGKGVYEKTAGTSQTTNVSGPQEQQTAAPRVNWICQTASQSTTNNGAQLTKEYGSNQPHPDNAINQVAEEIPASLEPPVNTAFTLGSVNSTAGCDIRSVAATPQPSADNLTGTSFYTLPDTQRFLQSTAGFVNTNQVTPFTPVQNITIPVDLDSAKLANGLRDIDSRLQDLHKKKVFFYEMIQKLQREQIENELQIMKLQNEKFMFINSTLSENAISVYEAQRLEKLQAEQSLSTSMHLPPRFSLPQPVSANQNAATLTQYGDTASSLNAHTKKRDSIQDPQSSGNAESASQDSLKAKPANVPHNGNRQPPTNQAKRKCSPKSSRNLGRHKKPHTEQSIDLPSTPPPARVTEQEGSDYSHIPTGQFTGLSSPVSHICLVGEYALTASENGELCKFDLATLKMVGKCQKHNEAITQMLVPCNEKRVVYTSSLDGYMKAASIEKLDLDIQCVDAKEPLQSMDIKWGMVYLGSRWGHVWTYETTTHVLSELSLCTSETSVVAIKAVKEGPRKVLVIVYKGNAVHIRDATSGLLLRSLNVPSGIVIHNTLLDYDVLYCGSQNNTIYKYDIKTGCTLSVWQGIKGCASMKPYKNCLLVACYDGIVYAFNKTNGKQITNFKGCGKMLLAMEIAGDKVIMSSKDAIMKCMAIPPVVAGRESAP